MQNAKITGIASYVPDYVLTNDELSHMVDTNDEWITCLLYTSDAADE